MINILSDRSNASTEIIVARRNYFNKLFVIIDTGEDKSIRTIIDEMKGVFSYYEDVELKDILKFIKFMANTSYRRKGDYMIDFIRSKANKEPLPEKPNFSKGKGYEIVPNRYKDIDRPQIITDRIKSELKEDSIKFDSAFITSIKKYLNSLDLDLVVDYMVKAYDLNPVSVEELEQLSYTLNFFAENLNANVERFSKLIPEKEEDAKAIRETEIYGEDDLSSFVKSDIGRLYSWKKKVLSNEAAYYEKFKSCIDKMIETKEVSKIDAKPLNAKDTIEHDSPFVGAYYDQLSKLFKVYDNNKVGLNTVTNTTKQEFMKKLSKRLIIDNKDIESEE